jgi:serine/threonine protein kinase
MVCRDNTQVRDYTIVRKMNDGAMAISYEAKKDCGARVFFKQYKSPSVRAPWYRKFIAYQGEMRRRIGAPPCSRFCYAFLDSFEEKRCFYQVFEFLDHGHSLQKILDDCVRRPTAVAWPQRVIMAKVLMMGISALHEAKIVHSDLKPDNIMLIEDREIEARYRVKIIDMDFSILTDVAPPWVGHEGFFGTPGYTSPEHHRGQMPEQASDVFTCGLMLYELLARGHPYQFDELDQISDAVLNGRAGPPDLRGEMEPPADTHLVQETIHRCLSPDPKERPSALEVNQVLNGPVFKSSEPVEPKRSWWRPTKKGPDARDPKSGEDAEEGGKERKEHAVVKCLVLSSAGGIQVRVNIRTEVGRAIAAQFDRDESRHWDHRQLVLERDDSEWFVTPREGTRNETLVNGTCVKERTKLNSGDILGVGREAKGIVKLPLTVDLE